MRLNWAYVAGLAFYMGATVVATQFLHFGGEKSNVLMYWLGALGITSYAFFALFQQKFYEWRDKKKNQASQMLQGGGAAAAGMGAAAPAAADGEGAVEVDHLIRDAET